MGAIDVGVGEWARPAPAQVGQVLPPDAEPLERVDGQEEGRQRRELVRVPAAGRGRDRPRDSAPWGFARAAVGYGRGGHEPVELS